MALSRRYFFYGSLLAGAIPVAGFGSSASLKSLGYKSPNEKLNFAAIGLALCHFGPMTIRRYAFVPAALCLACALWLVVFATREASQVMNSLVAFQRPGMGIPLSKIITSYWGPGMYAIAIAAVVFAYELRKYHRYFKESGSTMSSDATLS